MEQNSPEKKEGSVACENIVSDHVSMFTPEYHYKIMISCIKGKRYNEAALHYAIAGVQTWHDYLENPDPENEKRHNTELRKQLGKLNHQQIDLLWLRLNYFLKDKKQLNKLCSRITFEKDSRYIASFWEEAKRDYLHCENKRMLSDIV